MKRSRRKPRVEKFEVQEGGKGVVAQRIDHLHIHSDSGPKTVALSPFATVPPLPPSFVNRPELSEPVVQKLLSSSGMMALTALEGMAGVGKSVLALGICHDERIRARFSDGIIWLDIGKEEKVSKEDRIKRIAEAFNEKFSKYCEETYRTLFADRSVLVVLDDVWTQDAIEPLLINSARSRLLYTSRDKRLAGPLGAENFEVGTLDWGQARKFLAIWSGHQKEQLPEPYASDILTECKGLTLALAMVGAALKGKPDSRWEYLLADLKKARLRELGVRPVRYQYQNLHSSIAVSIDALEPDTKKQYLKLAILLEDMRAHPALLRVLWGGDERAVDDLMDLFVDRSLASRDAQGGIHVHDLQLDYMRGEHPDPVALDLERRTLLRSYHVVRNHPEQFATQMIGRLLAYPNQLRIAAILNELESNDLRPRLRPLRPALQPADGQTISVLLLTDSVTAVALSADGKRALSGCVDNSVRVWNAEGKEPPRLLEGHTSSVRAVALSADGKRALSGSEDWTVRVWDVEGPQPPRVLEGHTDQVMAVALSGDGKRGLSGSADKTLRVWDLEGELPPQVLEGHTNSVTAVAMSWDGKRAVSGSVDNTVRVWDLEGELPPRVLEGHTSRVRAVALSGDGKRVLSGSHDRTVRVWDLEGELPPRVLEGHTSWVRAVALSADGKRALSGSADRTLRVWDLESKQPPQVVEGHTNWVTAVALSANGKRALSGSVDNTVRVWDLEGKQPALALKGHTDMISAVAMSLDGKRALSASLDYTVRVWDLEVVEAPRVLEGRGGWVTAVALSGDGKRALSGSLDGSVRVCDLEGKQSPRLLGGHTGRVRAVALSGDGKLALSGSDDRTVRVWDVQGKQPPRVLKGHTSRVRAVALLGNGKLALSGSEDETVRVWDLESKHPSQVLEGHTGWVRGVALSWNGKLALSASEDKTVRLWDLESKQPPRLLEGHTDWVTAVVFSGDGKRALSASDDHTLRVWDLEKERQVAAFTCDAALTSCCWRQDRIAAGDTGGQLHVFAWEE